MNSKKLCLVNIYFALVTLYDTAETETETRCVADFYDSCDTDPTQYRHSSSTLSQILANYFLLRRRNFLVYSTSTLDEFRLCKKRRKTMSVMCE